MVARVRSRTFIPQENLYVNDKAVLIDSHILLKAGSKW